MKVTISNNGREDNFNIVPINQLVTVPRAAIYTVWTYIPSTGQYPLLYVGQTGNIGERLDTNHHKYPCWINDAINNELYVGYWMVPSDQYSVDQRLTLENALIEAHKPTCNG